MAKLTLNVGLGYTLLKEKGGVGESEAMRREV